MKKLLSILFVAIFLLAGAYAESATATLQELYAQAELLMVQGDYAGASAKFESLGAYSDASQMAMYCKAIYVAESLGMYSITVDALNDLGDFKDSKQLAVYYQGRSLEAAGAGIDLSNISSVSDADLKQAREFYDAARDIYAELALFKDGLTRIAACDSALEAIRAEQEVRESANQEAKYQQAIALQENGQFAEALELFVELGAYKDSEERSVQCQNVLLENQYQKAYALEVQGNYADAIVVYNTLNGYKDSADRAAYCEKHIGYEDIRSFCEGLAPVKRNGKWGYINFQGELVINCQYYIAFPFSESRARVKVTETGEWGFIDKTGKIVIPCKYSNAFDFSEGLAAVTKPGSNNFGFIDYSGKEILAYKYAGTTCFREGLATTKDGVVDKTGKYINIKFPATKLYDFHEGLVCCYEPQTRTSSKCIVGYADKSGKLVIPLGSQYMYAGNFSEGYAYIGTKDRQFSFIDTTGRVVLNLDTADFDTNGFSNGMVAVKKNEKWGFINIEGEVVIPYEYDACTRFCDGYLILLKNDVISILDENLNQVF